MINHYKTLEVDQKATQDEIKNAYRNLAKKFHPDKNQSDKAEKVFKEINKAYEILSDPLKRSDYDRQLNPASHQESVSYQPVYNKNQYTKSAWRKGKILIWVLVVIAIVAPLIGLRYSSKYNYEEGLQYYREGQIPMALVYFDRAIKEFGSRKIEASLTAIEVCYEHGYISQGIVFAQKGSSYIYNKKTKGNLAYKEGLGWEMLEQLGKAVFSFEKALDLGYRTDSVYMHLGMINGFELENYQAAINNFDILIEEFQLQSFYLQRGITHQNHGNFNAAISDLNSFIEKNPENGMGYFFLGISLIESGELSKACDAFGKARDLGIDGSRSYLELHCNGLFKDP